MRRRKSGRVIALREDLPIGRFVPNGLTLLGLSSGATAIPLALSENWKAAVVAIVLAAIFDMLDGRVARLFNADSKFGAQLDSLADLVSFGIAPSVLVYMWTLHHAGGAGWTIALVFSACCAIRLARFNVDSDDDEEEDDDADDSLFTGVPTPAAACIILLPMILSFQFHGTTIFTSQFLNGAVMATASLLMVSRIPTLSLKQFYVPTELKGAVLAFLGFLVCSAVIWPWATMSVGLLAYLISLPAGRKPPGRLRRRFTRPPEPPSAP